MKKLLLVISFLVISSFAAASFTLERVVLTSEIVNREPSAPVETFSLYSKGFFFNEYKDIGEEEIVTHNWYFIDSSEERNLMASVPLKIRGNRWRTWSSKNLFLAGTWLVEVADKEGNIITSKKFIVE